MRRKGEGGRGNAEKAIARSRDSLEVAARIIRCAQNDSYRRATHRMITG
jgi:hypothetical protein